MDIELSTPHEGASASREELPIGDAVARAAAKAMGYRARYLEEAFESGPVSGDELQMLAAAQLLAAAQAGTFTRVSKHRAGRQPKMTRDQRKKRDRLQREAVQASKSATEDMKAVLRGQG